MTITFLPHAGVSGEVDCCTWHGFSRNPLSSQLGCALVAVAWLLLLAPGTTKAAHNEWKIVGAGIAFREATIVGPSFFSSSLIFLQVDLRKNRLGILRAAEAGKVRSDVATLAEKSHAIIAINANFFVQDGAPLGLVVSRGILHNKMHKGGSTLTGVFQASLSEAKIVRRSDFRPAGVVEAVQAGPILLKNGKPLGPIKDSSYSRRAGVCIDKAGDLIIFCTSGGLLGITLGQLQEALTRKEIGCVDAINFDGGGSAQLYADIPPGPKLLDSKSDGYAISSAVATPPPNTGTASSTSDDETDALRTGVLGMEGFKTEVKGNDEIPIALGVFPLIREAAASTAG